MKVPVSVSTTIPMELAEFVEKFCDQFNVSRAIILREAILSTFHKYDDRLPTPATSYLETILASKKVRSKKV